jgi:prepilin peptidase CpaA
VLAYFDLARQVILLALLAVAAYTDLAFGKVYNWSTLPAIVLGLMLGYILGGVNQPGASFSLLNSVYGIALAGGIFGVFFLFEAFGAADLKLAAAIGALTGWYFAFVAIIYASLIGGILAIAVLVWKGQLRRGLHDSAKALARPGKLKKGKGDESPARLTVPYGFALSVGTLWAWFSFHVL